MNPKSTSTPVRLRYLALSALALGVISACGDVADPASDNDTGLPDTGADSGDVGIDALPDAPNDAADDSADGVDADAGPDDVATDGETGGDADAGDTALDTDIADTVFDADVPDAEPPEPAVRVRLEAEVVECAPLPALDSGARCEVTTVGTSGARMVRGDILGDAVLWQDGAVLIGEDGRIECVGCDCAVGDATVIDCPGAAVSPGLINAHDHITYTYDPPGEWGDERFDHRHDWRIGARGHNAIRYGRSTDDTALIQWGELRQLIAGTTSLVGSGGAPGLLRNLDQAGATQEGLGQGRVDYSTFPLGDQGGTLRTANCAYPEFEPTSVLNADCYLPHIAEGIDPEARNEFLCLTSTERGGRDLVEENTAIVHAIAMTAEDAREIALNGASVIWSPRSNIALYGNTAPVTLFSVSGVNVGIGTDWTPSGSLHMNRELSCAAYLNDTHFGGWFTDFELWRMATVNNALALHVDDAVGALRPGLVADIAVFDVRDALNPWRGIFEAGPEDVALVLRGGTAVYGDALLLPAVLGDTTGCESIGNVCGSDKWACIERETGRTFADLQTANAASYGLFFCGEPAGEPTCVPTRGGEYAGPSSDDIDGDGVLNELDACPTVFDAIRPVDGDSQADGDLDGIGDACDVCPLVVGESCTIADPNDRDGDGFVNAADNCPRDANPDQADADADNVGDACDACPLTPNPGGSPCPYTIAEIRRGVVPNGTTVRTTGVVTAVGSDLMYIQMPAETVDTELGADFSGIALYSFSGFDDFGPPAVGDTVRVDGTLGGFRGETQLASISSLTAVGSGVIAPELVAVSDIVPGAARGEALESVLIELADIGVVSAGPSGVTLENGVRLGTRVFATTVELFEGDRIRLTGIPRRDDANLFVEIRSDADIDVTTPALPRLVSFGPAGLFVPAGVATPVNTQPEPLVVTLNRPAGAGGFDVPVVSGDPTRIPPRIVTVAAGETSAVVPVTTAGATPGDVELTATSADGSISATVTVYDPAAAREVVSVAPTTVSIATDEVVNVRLRLNLPAPESGLLVPIAVDEPTRVVVPVSIPIPAGQIEATLTLVGGTDTGASVVTVGEGADAISIGVTTVEFGPLRAPAAPGEVVITEIMARAASGSGDRGEYIELYNSTRSPLQLQGCTIADNSSHAIASSVIIEPLGYAVFAVSGNAAENGGIPTVDYVYSGITLNNSGEAITISCGELVLDTVDYGSSWVVLGASTQHATVPPNATANDDRANWCTAPVSATFGTLGRRGTPGAATVCE